MHLTILLFHPCLLYMKLIKKQANIMVQQGQNYLGVRIIMTPYISLYYKVSITLITEIFVTMLF